MDEKAAKRFFRGFALIAFGLLGITMLIVVLIDPFFHYHAPWFGLKPVQTKKEFQVDGALDHLDYDALLLGSSVTVNINTNAYDEAFGCHTLKACANAADPCTLCYFIRRGDQHHKLRYVFWGLDCASLFSEVSEDSTSGQVLYLRDKNLINDVEYWWNIDVLLKEIPNMIAVSFLHEYDVGDAYEFTRFSTYNIEEVLDFYQPDGEIFPMRDIDNEQEMENVYKNVAFMQHVIEEHPETEFKIHLSLFSILWWDNQYREGCMEQYLSAWEYTVKTLDSFENVTFFTGVFNDPEYLMNLNLYCDYCHADYNTNQLQARSVTEADRIITADTVDEELDRLRQQIYTFEDRLAEEGSWEFLYEYAK